jgi:hypothetical protein
MFTAERALKRQIISGNSFSTVMVGSFNIMQGSIGHIGWLDFHRAAESTGKHKRMRRIAFTLSSLLSAGGAWMSDWAVGS